MSSLNIELRDYLLKLVRDEFEEVYGIACEVSNVRELENQGWVCDCAPLNKKPIIRAVRLKAESEGGVLIIPSEGSVVFVTMESEAEGFVSMYGKIDSVQFFDGAKGGLINIEDLVSKLNNLEGALNDVVDKLKIHTHAGVTTGAGLSGVSTEFIAVTPLPETVKEDIEDVRIKH